MLCISWVICIVVTVKFSTDTNIFNEDNGIDYIGVEINRIIAQSLEVFIFGGIHTCIQDLLINSNHFRISSS